MSIENDPGYEMFAFFEMTPDLVCIAGKDGYFKKVNPSVIKKLGYSEEELYAAPVSSFIYHEDTDITSRSRTELLGGKTLLNFVNRYVTKNGKIVWLEWTSVFLSDKGVVFAIAKDVTERKNLEKKVEEKYNKYKSLASHFKKSIEKDRKYLAYELHERLAQLVSAVKMDIDWVSNNVPGLAVETKTRIDNASAVSKILISTIQRISFSISPNMMDDFGLKVTLEWLCNEFSILNNIPCSFKGDYDEGSLTEEIKIDFFRICQESLTNIINHAHAARVKVSIKDKGDSIQLLISDDGKGFEINGQNQTSGFISMKERAASINGKLTIQSTPGKGTQIQVVIPKEK